MGFFEIEPRRPLLVPTPRGVRLDGSATKRGPVGPRGPQGVGADGAVQVAMSQQAGTAMRVGVNAGTVGLLVIGDSKGAGTGLTSFADRWQNRLLALMRARFPITGGDTMRGLVPANMSDPYNAMSGRPTTTGTTYPVDTAGLGYNTLQLELGSTVTFPAATWPAASTLPIGYHTHSGANGTLEVLVDGVVQTEIDCSGTGEGEPKRTSIPVSAGTHTVSMRPKAGTAPVRVMYAEQRSASTGWHLYDASRPGLAARHVVAGPPGAPSGDESFAAAVAGLPSVRLAVIALGANDMTISTPAQYGADVRGVVDMVKAGHPTAGVVVVLPAALTDDSAVVDDVQAYHAAARAALVDVPDLSILAETQLVDLTGPNAPAWLADSVHPNAFGHDVVARALAASLIGLSATDPTVVTSATITDATTVGKAVLSASDAAAARSAIDAATLAPASTPGLLDYTLPDDTPAPEPTPVTLLVDDFNRTAADLVGTSPQVGATWVGGWSRWSADGSVASASGAGELLSDVGHKNVTVTTVLRVTTTATGSNQSFRVYAASTPNIANGLWAAINIDTTGRVKAALWETFGGASAKVVDCPSPSLAANSATPQTLTVTLTIDGDTATIDCGAGPVTATFTPEKIASLSTYAGVYAGSSALPGVAVDSITATRPGDPVAPGSDGQIVTVSGEGVLPAVVLDSLDSRYGSSDPVVEGRVESGFEPLRALRAFGSGEVTVAVVSDSTANDGNDWLRLFVQKWGASVPGHVRRTYRNYNATTGQWNNTSVDNAGTPPDTGVIVDDDFSTVGPVAGSTPDTGPAWVGALDDGWASDGAIASAALVSGGVGVSAIGQNLGSKDQTVRLSLSLITAAGPSTQTFRVYAGGVSAAGAAGVWASLSVATGGGAYVSLYKTISGTTTSIGASTPIAGVDSNSPTPQAVTVEVTTAIQNVSVTVTAAGQVTQHTATITEADVETLGTWGAIYGVPPADGAAYGFRLESAHMRTPAADNPVAPPTLAVHNGAIGGGKLAVQFTQPNLDAMFVGITPDVLILAIGHNNGTQSAGGFTDEVAAWLTAWRQRYPNCAVIISTQNPQVSPASGVIPHRDRQAALRGWAKRQGHDYIPAFEAFAAQPDGGASLISDGVHPTTPPSGTTGEYGSVLWADTAVAALDG